MLQKSLNHIPFDSLKFLIKNYKKWTTIAIIPSIILAILSTVGIAEKTNGINIIITLAQMIILIPFTIRWTQLSLGQNIEIDAQDSTTWNAHTTTYLIKNIKVALLLFLPLIITMLIINATQTILFSPIVGIVLILYIWIFVIGVRFALILPAYIDGDNMSLKQALQNSKGMNTSILVSCLILLMMQAVLLMPITSIFFNIMLSNEIGAGITSTVMFFVYHIFTLGISAMQTTFLTKIYLHIKKS